MITNVFINLSTKDLNKTRVFMEALGWKINSQFSDDTAISVVISENIYAMLLTEAKMKQFTTKSLVDASQATEAINALSVDSKQAVDELVNKAVGAGAKELDREQYDFMKVRAFEDLDGHIWEVLWMDPSFVKPE